MRPRPEVVHEPVTLRVLVDVADDLLKVPVGVDFDALKRTLEEASGAAVRVVDGFGVAAKQVGKAAGNAAGREGFVGAVRSGASRANADEQVEVVRHQAVGVRVGDGRDVMGVLA